MTNRHLTVVGGSNTVARDRHEPGRDQHGCVYIVADDHPSVTLAVSQMLAEAVGVSPAYFATFTTSAELLAACAKPVDHVRIVVLDLVMPGDLKRVALVHALLELDPEARVIAYTAEKSAFLARVVMDAGAAGYVAKTSPVAELVDAVTVVAAGRRHVDQHIDLESIKMHPWSSLTECERGVLLDFCRGAKAHDIMESSGRTYSTVTTHKYNGLNKLGLRDVTEVLSYVYANGLLHELDVDPGT